MNRWNRLAGAFGLVLFGFGVFGGLVIESFSQPLIATHILLGLVLMGVWAVTTGVRSFSSAGAALTGRAARFGYHALFATAVSVGLLVAVNWLISRHNRRWDLTEQGVYSLSSQSAAIVKGIKKPLKIVGLDLAVEDRREGSLKELLELYKYNNPDKVSVELLNPQAKPHLVDRYGFKPGNLVYISYGEGDSAGVSRINDASEEAITNAILKLQRGESKTIYVVEGHDEPSIESGAAEGFMAFSQALADENLAVKKIVLGLQGTIPDDAAAVVLASPKKGLLKEERELLIAYVESGGNLLLLGDPRTTEDVRQIAGHFGITVGHDVVIDQVQRLFAAPALGAQPIAREYASHPITKQFGQAQLTIYNVASSVTASTTSDGDITRTELVKTGPSAWGETNVSALFDSDEPTAVREGGDLQGPVSLAVAYEKKLPVAKGAESSEFTRSAKLVVFGDTDWVLNANISTFANRDLVLNSINWLTGEEGGISLRAKSIRTSMAPITESTFALLLAISFLVPELIVLGGLSIWMRRRYVAA